MVAVHLIRVASVLAADAAGHRRLLAEARFKLGNLIGEPVWRQTQKVLGTSRPDVHTTGHTDRNAQREMLSCK